VRAAAPAGGDGGWDIVIVNNFHDQKSPRIIVLGNCATGKTDWLNKGQEAAPKSFWKSFTKSPIEDNVCLTFVAVPFLMTDDEKDRKLWRDSLSFDRMRICEKTPTASDDVMEWLNRHRETILEVPFK
jgi:hypothetical protein